MPPPMKPMAAHTHAFRPSDAAISMEGESSDQNEAAIITPPAKPSIASRAVLFIRLNMKTTPAPSAVTLHVNIVASSACTT